MFAARALRAANEHQSEALVVVIAIAIAVFSFLCCYAGKKCRSFEYAALTQHSDDDDVAVHMCVVGLTGVGKSNLLNALANDEKLFESRHQAEAVSQTTLSRNVVRKSRHKGDVGVKLIDTPGLQDGKGDEDHLRNMMIEMRNMHHLHSILMVVNFEDPRLTLGMADFVQRFATEFGPESFRYVSLVFTNWVAKPELTAIEHNEEKQRVKKDWMEKLQKRVNLDGSKLEDRCYFVDSVAALVTDSQIIEAAGKGSLEAPGNAAWMRMERERNQSVLDDLFEVALERSEMHQAFTTANLGAPVFKTWDLSFDGPWFVEGELPAKLPPIQVESGNSPRYTDISVEFSPNLDEWLGFDRKTWKLVLKKGKTQWFETGRAYLKVVATNKSTNQSSAAYTVKFTNVTLQYDPEARTKLLDNITQDLEYEMYELELGLKDDIVEPKLRLKVADVVRKKGVWPVFEDLTELPVRRVLAKYKKDQQLGCLQVLWRRRSYRALVLVSCVVLFTPLVIGILIWYHNAGCQPAICHDGHHIRTEKLQCGGFNEPTCSSKFCCKNNTCTCLHGVGATGKNCTRNHGHMCDSCDPTRPVRLEENSRECVPKNGYHSDPAGRLAFNQCRCKHGSDAIGDVCPVDGGPQCMSCVSGFQLTLKRLCVPKDGFHLTANGDIEWNVCSCPHGFPARGVECPAPNASRCKACQRHFHLAYKEQKCEIDGGYEIVQNKIRRAECRCNHGQAKLGEQCTWTGGESCLKCDNHFYLHNSTDFKSISCKIQDGYFWDGTIALKKLCKCSHGTPSTYKDCKVNGALHCISCEHHFTLEGHACQLKIGFTFNFTMHNRVVAKMACHCQYGLPATNCADPSIERCKACNPNFHLLFASRCVVDAAFYVAGSIAVLKHCRCQHGTPSRGKACPANGASSCTACDDAFKLNKNVCEKRRGYTVEGKLNKCVCRHGTAPVGHVCKRDGAPQCSDCDRHFVLQSKSSTCELKEGYFYDGFKARKKVCACSHGVSSFGKACREDNWPGCQSCDAHYKLSIDNSSCVARAGFHELWFQRNSDERPNDLLPR